MKRLKVKPEKEIMSARKGKKDVDTRTPRSLLQSMSKYPKGAKSKNEDKPCPRKRVVILLMPQQTLSRRCDDEGESFDYEYLLDSSPKS